MDVSDFRYLQIIYTILADHEFERISFSNFQFRQLIINGFRNLNISIHIYDESNRLYTNLYEGLLLRIPVWRQQFSGLINSIHMIGMKYPISVFWISCGRIVDKAIALPGFHIYSPSHPSSVVLELPEKAFYELNVGDFITISNANQSIHSQMEYA